MTARHDFTTQALHWLVAVAIALAYGLALWRDELPKGDFRNVVTGLHMSAGVLVLALSAVRIAWRPFSRALPPVDGSPLMQALAKAGHLALYVAMLAVPVVGMLMVWAKGRPVPFFGLSIPAPFAIGSGLAKPLEEVHEVTANFMMIMAGLHAAAAIGHQVLLKDGTLARMVPFGRRAEQA